MNRSVIQHPFVPFSILFTRAIQLWDTDDLTRLEGFAASLRPEQASNGPNTSFHRLYELLCQAARLYINANIPYLNTHHAIPSSISDSLDTELTNLSTEAGVSENSTVQPTAFPAYELSDWYLGNQQLMSILDDDIMF